MERGIQETTSIDSLIDIANKDTSAEFEVKLLAGKIQTRDISERITTAIESLSREEPTEEHRLTYSYSDGIRVHILEPQVIHKVCVSQSFKGLPVDVERKTPYFQSTGERDVVDAPEVFTRFTLRSEKHIKKDHSGDVNDKRAYIRILSRKSYRVVGGEFQIDFSLVKSKTGSQTLHEILKNIPSYELEIEYTPRNPPRSPPEVRASLFRIIETLLRAYQQTDALLTYSEIQKYIQEFRYTANRFYNVVPLERKHISSILKGYTVTNKADGLRAGLYVARDRRVLRITQNGENVCWTGLVCANDKHVEDFLDGEYLENLNLFCIFDVYRYQGKNVKGLPLFITEEDIRTNPTSSRLGCARIFVQDIATDFRMIVPGFRIETKMFLSGDGPSMEEAIKTLLDTKFDYETDGLVFTPRASAVSPPSETRGSVWLSVYKWKPPHQNSIDFLLRFQGEPVYDPLSKTMGRQGMLYVSRTPGEDIIYPCETITGEYVPPKLPEDLQRISESRDRVPSPFQPSAPRNPEAYKIVVPIDKKGVPYDISNKRVEDNTIIECSYNTETHTWSIMRTRYDKTYQYRILKRPQYGNDILTAESTWTLIWTPVSEDMLTHLVSNPPDETFADDAYYHDETTTEHITKNIRGFHNRIKFLQYETYVIPGNTLLELAVGRGGDLFKWKKTKPSHVLGIDLSETNLTMKRGACVRYLTEKRRSNEKLPKVLFAQGDMSKLFEEQNSRYLKIVFGNDESPTPYISEFKIKLWDIAACQFAIHYACESEEVFKTFVQNLKNHCKSVFFGTCLDGMAVYSAMAGKDLYVLRSNGKTFVQIQKKYTDDGDWKSEFGQKIDVTLESTETAISEYLVPFDKVQAIMAEAGFDLLETKTFGELYTSQSGISLDNAQQEYSFLHRTFAFKRRSVPVPEPPSEPEPVPEPEPAPSEPAPVPEPSTEKPKVRRKIIKKEAAPLPEIVFFFSKNPENAFLSSFYETTFKMGDKEYKTAEHAFQAEKAATFDAKMVDKIINAKSAQSAKSFGKKIENYNEETWNSKKEGIMRSIVNAKFTQNAEIKKQLIETGDKRIANADPRDTYWGIGTSSGTGIAKDPALWKGENMLGKILMDLRSQLKTEEEEHIVAASKKEE